VVAPPLGGTLDGSIDGSIDGDACAREAEPAPPDPFDYGDDPPEDQSGPFADAAAATAAPPRTPGRRYTIAPPTPEELATAADLPRPPNHWPKSFPEPEPSRFCDKHPGGSPGSCPRCGDARKAHEAWDGRRQKFNAELADVKRKWVTACLACDDEHGHVLGPDRKVPDDAAEWCMHIRLWQAYWIGRGVIPMRAAS
jgi:hypothetical protein